MHKWIRVDEPGLAYPATPDTATHIAVEEYQKARRNRDNWRDRAIKAEGGKLRKPHRRTIVCRDGRYYLLQWQSLEGEKPEDVVVEALDWIRENGDAGWRLNRILDNGSGLWEAEILRPL